MPSQVRLLKDDEPSRDYFRKFVFSVIASRELRAIRRRSVCRVSFPATQSPGLHPWEFHWSKARILENLRQSLKFFAQQEFDFWRNKLSDLSDF
jgi:hypothetical protein